MFRMGGRSDDGIMSLRPGFQPGGIVPGSILTTGGGVMPPGSGTTPSPISTVQRFYQASANFVAALLRKESGAAIAESEYRDAYKQYFPQLGDSAETILTKQNAREAVIRNMVGAAGDALTDFHPAVQKYLQTEIEGKKYDSFDTKGYVKYLDKKIMDTKGQLFRLKIQGKTLDQLKNMLADPKANEKLANYQILIIDELIDAKLTSED